MTDDPKMIVPFIAELPRMDALTYSDIINAAARVPADRRDEFFKAVADVLRPIQIPLLADVKRACRIAHGQIDRRT